MPSIEILLTFTLATLIMHISPGPSNLYVMARSISQGVSGGIAAAIGLAVGGFFHVLATVLGLATIFKHSPTLYTAVKLLGAVYLIYLGIKYFRTNSSDEDIKVKKSKYKPLSRIFYESVLIEITNPKTALFFIAFLPQFVNPEIGSVSFQLFIFGIIVVVSAIPIDTSVAIFSSKVASLINKSKKAQVIQERVSGSILFGLGSFIGLKEIKNILLR
ncbi:LysE family translocator [Malaciobacter halophilus]|nr:LysE family translocator [Malaciobacter halophilus]RYA24374.1 LysE family translocator [Malaciobacter halophilus]